MLIAFTGAAGAGKDTAALALKRKAAFQVTSFAYALKNSCIFKFGLSHDDVFTQEGKKRLVPEWGFTVREILQREGSEATKGYWGQKFWATRWFMDYVALQDQGFENITVTDCRFEVEAQLIHDLGGKIIRINRPGHHELTGAEASHMSEAKLNNCLVDVEITNGGLIRDLHADVLQAYEAFGGSYASR